MNFLPEIYFFMVDVVTGPTVHPLSPAGGWMMDLPISIFSLLLILFSPVFLSFFFSCSSRISAMAGLHAPPTPPPTADALRFESIEARLVSAGQASGGAPDRVDLASSGVVGPEPPVVSSGGRKPAPKAPSGSVEEASVRGSNPVRDIDDDDDEDGELEDVVEEEEEDSSTLFDGTPEEYWKGLFPMSSSSFAAAATSRTKRFIRKWGGEAGESAFSIPKRDGCLLEDFYIVFFIFWPQC